MNEEFKTIKELADELGTNKSKIFRIIKNRSIKTYRERNKIVLNKKAIKVIKSEFTKDERVAKTQNERNNDTIFDTISLLKNELEIAHEQNNKLLESQKQTQNLLDQQQRLASQDKKLLEEYKSEINSLKALKIPQEDMQLKEEKKQPQESLETLKSEIMTLQEQLNEKDQLLEQEKSKKWYHFWK